MDPTAGLAMMIGLLSVVSTSDTFPAVLIGIPGSVSAQATVMAGFPLAKKGEAERALAAALASSMMGCVFGALRRHASARVARPLVLTCGRGGIAMTSGRDEGRGRG